MSVSCISLLIRLLFELFLHNFTKLIIKLFRQIFVRLVVDVLQNTPVGRDLCLAISLLSFELMLPLLVYGLLMEHIESGITVTWAHQSRLVVDLWGEEALAVFIEGSPIHESVS